MDDGICISYNPEIFNFFIMLCYFADDLRMLQCAFAHPFLCGYTQPAPGYWTLSPGPIIERSGLSYMYIEGTQDPLQTAILSTPLTNQNGWNGFSFEYYIKGTGASLAVHAIPEGPERSPPEHVLWVEQGLRGDWAFVRLCLPVGTYTIRFTGYKTESRDVVALSDVYSWERLCDTAS